MELEFVFRLNESEQSDSVNFIIVDKTNNVEIGYAEGYLTKGNGLISVINLFDGYRERGIGKTIFLKIIELLGGVQKIEALIGSWHRGGEFGHLEMNRSTNLLVFQQYLQKGCSEKEAAAATPTGKWAASLGYSVINVLSVADDEVSVAFSKAE